MHRALQAVDSERLILINVSMRFCSFSRVQIEPQTSHRVNPLLTLEINFQRVKRECCERPSNSSAACPVQGPACAIHGLRQRPRSRRTNVRNTDDVHAAMKTRPQFGKCSFASPFAWKCKDIKKILIPLRRFRRQRRQTLPANDVKIVRPST